MTIEVVDGAVHGADGFYPSAMDRPFSWPLARDLRSLRVGYVEGQQDVNRRELTVLRDALCELVELLAFEEREQLGQGMKRQREIRH